MSDILPIKKRGRPRIHKVGYRSRINGNVAKGLKPITLWVEEDEAKAIRAAAQKARLTIREYLRRRVLWMDIEPPPAARRIS